MPKINALPNQNAPDGSDVFPTDDVSDTNTTKKLTLTTLKEWFQSLTGWITAAMMGAGSVTNTVLSSGATGVANANLSTVVGDVGGVWKSWTPTFTNVVVGNGTVDAKYTVIGKTIICRISFILGSTSSVSGVVNFSLPFTALNTVGQYVGSSYAERNGSFGANCFLQLTSSTTINLVAQKVDGTYSQNWNTGATVPFVWANTDYFKGEFFYEAA